MDVNDALEIYVGSLGRFQKAATCVVLAVWAISALSLIDVVYMTSTPHFWYVYNGEELNQTMIQQRMDVCKFENGKSFAELGAGSWQFKGDEFRSSLVSRVSRDMPKCPYSLTCILAKS